MDQFDWRSLPHDKLLKIVYAKHKITRGLGSKVAKELGISRGAVSQIVNGLMPIPQDRFLDFLEASGIKPEDVNLISREFIKAAKTPRPPRIIRLPKREVSKRDLQWLMTMHAKLKPPVTFQIIVELLKNRLSEKTK